MKKKIQYHISDPVDPVYRNKIENISLLDTLEFHEFTMMLCKKYPKIFHKSVGVF